MSEQTKKPNSYPSEFKESAVKLAIESDQTIAKTVKDLGGQCKYLAYLDREILKAEKNC